MTDKALNYLEDFLVEYVDNIPAINEGGCGYVALFLSEQLDKAGIKHQIILMAHNTYDETDNAACLIGHLLVEVDNFYFDSKGMRERLSTFYIPNKISRQNLQKLIKYGKWNPTFDLKHVKTLKSIFSNLHNKLQLLDYEKCAVNSSPGKNMGKRL